MERFVVCVQMKVAKGGNIGAVRIAKVKMRFPEGLSND